MNDFAALDGLRIGCVKYLNSRPLIDACPGDVVFEHPSQLARELAAGQLDAALVPIYEALGERKYLAVDDVAIACDGPVYSVFLAHRYELQNLRTIVLDPASLTSAHLVQVLLREFHGVAPQCIGGEAPELDETTGHLLIGNQAIEYREHASGDVRFLDLGEEWKRCTGLPFVFALWLLRPDLPDAGKVGDAFRELKRCGVAQIPRIVREQHEVEESLAVRYLTEHVRFDLGSRERAAIDLFRSLLRKHELIERAGKPLEFV